MTTNQNHNTTEALEAITVALDVANETGTSVTHHNDRTAITTVDGYLIALETDAAGNRWCDVTKPGDTEPQDSYSAATYTEAIRAAATSAGLDSIVINAAINAAA